MADALDVADWQGAIDAAAARDSADGRVALIIVKTSEGTRASNRYAAQQVASTKAAGLRVGAYHFALGGDPIAEANAFLATARAAGVDTTDPVLMLDLEPYPGRGWPLDQGGTLDFTARWLDHVAANSPAGAMVGFYSYPDFIARLLPRDERVDRYACWIADPSAWERGFAPRTGGRPYVLHQIGVAPYAGIAGNVDINVFGPAYSTAPPEPPAPKRSASTMFYAIIVRPGEYPRTFEVDGGIILRELDYNAERGAYAIHKEALDSGLPVRRVDNAKSASVPGTVWDLLKTVTALAVTDPRTPAPAPPVDPAGLTNAELITELGRRLS